jgi:restriction endonuclease Mrr
LAEILRESRAPEPAPSISPLIAEVELPQAPPPPAAREENRLDVLRIRERCEIALRRLLEELACEVLARELLLAPIEVESIVARLRERYGFADGSVVSNGLDVAIACGGEGIDASLGRRTRSAIGRAL